jgi:hypothetical protein
MAWTDSRVFQQAILNPLARGVAATTGFPTGYLSQGLLADTVNVALFNNTTTPDRTVAVGSTGFNTGVWVLANEVTDVTNWVSGGRALLSKTYALDVGSSSICFGAANLSGGGNVTLSNVFGCLVYDNTISGGTVSKQGMCYNYFGGSQSVSAGTFTIVWATPGGAAVTAIFNFAV